MLSEGKYTAQAVGNNGSYAELGESANKGSPQVTVRFEITSGPAKGERIVWIGSLAGGAAQYTIRSLRALGLTGDDITAVESQNLGREVEIVVGHETYNGKTSPRIKFVNAISSRPMQASGRAALVAEMRQLLRAQPSASAPAPSAPRAQPSHGPGVDDDMPF